MSLRINQNVVALSTYGSLNQTSGRLEKSIEKLSSGMRINRAADDAAGLAISEKMRRQIRGLNRAVSNAQDAISMIQTAEGAMNETHSILHRMRELAIQSSNDTLTSGDRLEIQKEVVQLRDDLDRIARNTEFNTKKLLDGSQTALISASSAAVNGIINGNPSNASGDYSVSIAMIAAGISEMQRSQIFVINDGSGELADGSTQLQSIAQFYNDNGVFVLDSPLTLTLSGNARSTTVTLDAQMTLDNLSASFQNAINSGSGLNIANSRTATVNTAQTRVAGLGGYIEITSGSIGDLGSISICGNQSIIDSLGMSVSRKAANNLTEIIARDSFGNVKSVRTETDRAFGLLNGIDVEFESQAAQIAGTSGLEAGLVISAAGGETMTVAIGTASVAVVIASGYWTMGGLARSLNAQIQNAIPGAADLKGLEASVVEGEIRLSFSKPATAAETLATTITLRNVANSSLGLVNGIFSGFVDGSKETSRIEWGFSQYVDTAKYTLAAGSAVVVTVQDGIGLGSAQITIIQTVLGAGDEQIADMKSFRLFQASANQILQNATVAVRVDQHGGAMAFTSLRVGSEHETTRVNSSLVSLVMTSTITSFMQNIFGLSEGTMKGSGDANFKMHVVNNQPQFQVGADQGQNMKIAIADMTSKALSVDKLDLTTVAGSEKALGKINKAIDTVSSERSKLGSFQNRLEYAVSNLRNTSNNLTAAESRIRDADMASEMIEFTRNQIVSQSGTAMLAQANALPQGVLQLLQ
ncbi:MAG TPA: flagellin [Candidatus Rifleibacterium sp.]|nr:flagellin [Candidatus Rifleibacterium sp.]HPT45440.1 flagellin [Candidatus Rifleibacterium sp.]